jgi:hypothetical protein
MTRLDGPALPRAVAILDEPDRLAAMAAASRDAGHPGAARPTPPSWRSPSAAAADA